MDRTTRWIDTINDNIQNVIEKIVDKEKFKEDNFKNWNECFFEEAFKDNKKIELNGRSVEYNYIKGSYLESRASHEPIRVDLKIIIYLDSENKINYIINRNSDALTILRKLLGFKSKGEIEKKMPNIDDDFLFWVINKIYTDSPIETESVNLETLYLESIKHFSGDSEDLQTKVSAQGESVMNLISSLSFFLESRCLNNIKLELKYRKNYGLALNFMKNSIGIDTNNYLGEYKSDDENETYVKLYLLIYLEIMTILVEAYNREVENAEWNDEVYKGFLKEIGEKIDERIRIILDKFDEKTKLLSNNEVKED